jgi:hypothetical protein
VLQRGTRRGEEENVAAWPIAGQAGGLFRNSVWALALAGRGECGGRVGRGWWLSRDQGWLGLDLGRWRRWLGVSRALLPAAAIASRLVAAALFPVGGRPVALSGTPAPPALGRVLAGRTTEPSLGPMGQEPAFTPFEQATAAAGVPAARAGQGAGWLTLGRDERRLRMAHGRDCSRAVRRREGGTSRRHFAPTRWWSPVGNSAARTSQPTWSDSEVPCPGGPERRESQSRDRRIAEWLNWLCESGSVVGRC